VPVSGVSPHVEGMVNPGRSTAGPGNQVNDGPAAIASGLSVGQLSSGELATVAGSLRELGPRVDRFRVRLSGLQAHGGVHGLLSRAGQLRQGTGAAPVECVAAAAVELINRGNGKTKLAPWWRAQP
jgi:hypothetical protein